MTIIKRILSISTGLSLLSLLFISSTLLGILTDRQEDALEYYMPAGNVGIELNVDNGTDDAIQIVPNQTTPLNISITNTGTKDRYVVCEDDDTGDRWSSYTKSHTYRQLDEY